MTSASSDWPGTPEGEELFAAFLDQREADGSGLELNAFCDRHPEHAGELRRLYALFNELEPFMEDADGAGATLALAAPSSPRST